MVAEGAAAEEPLADLVVAVVAVVPLAWREMQHFSACSCL